MASKNQSDTKGKALFSEEQIRKRVAEIARQISKDYQGNENGCEADAVGND